MKSVYVSSEPFCIPFFVWAVTKFFLKNDFCSLEYVAPYGGFPITISKPSFEGRLNDIHHSASNSSAYILRDCVSQYKRGNDTK